MRAVAPQQEISGKGRTFVILRTLKAKLVDSENEGHASVSKCGAQAQRAVYCSIKWCNCITVWNLCGTGLVTPRAARGFTTTCVILACINMFTHDDRKKWLSLQTSTTHSMCVWEALQSTHPINSSSLILIFLIDNPLLFNTFFLGSTSWYCVSLIQLKHNVNSCLWFNEQISAVKRRL